MTDTRLETARKAMLGIIAARKKWGRQLSMPYSIDRVFELIVDIAPLLEPRDCPEQLISKEELTKLNRAYAACRNRETARSKRNEE